jgi:tricarballylate dehydrogenase
MPRAIGILLAAPSFEAYAVTWGLTFTFGGLKIDTSARVMEGAPISRLFAAGELVSGIFYFNYSDGNAMFGRIADATAGQRAAQSP